MSLHPLDSQVQSYAWGSTSWIPEFLGKASDSRPAAELWVGAHSRLPSELIDKTDSTADLRALIGSDPARYLGDAQKFGGLPFLLKLLAAAEPLSLQAHPNSAQARAGFEREEAQGIPPSASHRNYKDARHKPELILALQTFEALSGFRCPTESVEFVTSLWGRCSEAPTFAALLSGFGNQRDEDGLRRFFGELFRLPRPELIALTRHVESLVEGETFSHAQWVGVLAKKFPGDPGVIAAALLHHIRLEPGEAIFLPAGNLHAYLSGMGLEIMASSDNVLRGGLTPKHVDVDELNKVLLFEPYRPEVTCGTELSRGVVRETRFTVGAEDFELSLLNFDGVDPSSSALSEPVTGPELWLGMEGEIYFEQGGQTQVLQKGQQLFVSPGEPLLLFGKGQAARASLPR